jgi:hypothetical protein
MLEANIKKSGRSVCFPRKDNIQSSPPQINPKCPAGAAERPDQASWQGGDSCSFWGASLFEVFVQLD